MTTNYSQHSSYWTNGTRGTSGNALKRLSSSTLGLTNANAYELATPPAKQPSNLNYASYSHIMSDMAKRRLRSANNSPVRAAHNTSTTATRVTTTTTTASSSTSPKRANIAKISPTPGIGSFVTKSTRSRSDLTLRSASSSNYGYQKTSTSSNSATRTSNLPTRVGSATHRVHPQQLQVTANVQALYSSAASSSHLRQPRSYSNHQLPLNVLAASSARLLQGATAGSGTYLRGTNHL